MDCQCAWFWGRATPQTVHDMSLSWGRIGTLLGAAAPTLSLTILACPQGQSPGMALAPLSPGTGSYLACPLPGTSQVSSPSCTLDGPMDRLGTVLAMAQARGCHRDALYL
jgi:hypothetical protein